MVHIRTISRDRNNVCYVLHKDSSLELQTAVLLLRRNTFRALGHGHCLLLLFIGSHLLAAQKNALEEINIVLLRCQLAHRERLSKPTSLSTSPLWSPLMT